MLSTVPSPPELSLSKSFVKSRIVDCLVCLGGDEGLFGIGGVVFTGVGAKNINN